jgi:hypothetical protein
MRLPKHRLYMGHAIVGIHVKSSRNDTTAMHIVVFHLPRGAKRSDLMDRQAVSMPNTMVMYPTMKIATQISQMVNACILLHIPGNVIIESPRHLLDNTL